MADYRLLSPAKLNLHLEVLAAGNDGYHELQSVFQTINLCDTIALRLSVPDRMPFSCRISGPFDFPPEKNLMYRAARLFAEATGCEFSLDISIEKRIPAGGGLGGGSGNAATVLSALNRHFDSPVDDPQLLALGAALGSDVPFFLCGKAALARGRGEILTTLPVRQDAVAVLVTPGIAINTADAYREWDRAFPDPPREPLLSDEEVMRAFSAEPVKAWPYQNSFFNVLAPLHPVLAEIREILYSKGSDYANLTGSGSCLFGMFTDREKAQSTVRSLESRYPGVQLVAPFETVN